MIWGRRTMVGGVVFGLLVLTVALASQAGAATLENEPPLADAGLDRDLQVNATLYLDAGASRDPDGTIDAYEWEIERPDGTTTAPRCRTCAQTEFVVRSSGQYNVTVTVTDDDGAQRSDTLIATVAEADGPSVTLTGPSTVVGTRNESNPANATAAPEFTATMEAGTEPLERIEWQVDGATVSTVSLDGDAATEQVQPTLEPGNHTITVVVSDRYFRQTTETREVEVREPAGRPSRPCADAVWNATAAVWDTSGCSDAGDSGGVDTSTASGESDRTDRVICSDYQRTDDRHCEHDRLLMADDTVIIHDANEDGTVEWAGETLDRDFATNHDGVTINSVEEQVEFESVDAYKDALDVNEVNTDPTADVNQYQEDDDVIDNSDEENSGDNDFFGVDDIETYDPDSGDDDDGIDISDGSDNNNAPGGPVGTGPDVIY